MKRSIQLSLTLFMLTAIAFPTIVSADNPGNQIAGTWEVHVDAGDVQFTDLSSMTRDGQVITVNPGGGTALGGWQRVRGRTYDVSFTGFMPGEPPARATIFSTVELSTDGQEFSGPFLTEFRDLEGNLLFDLEGTVNGTRLPVIGF